MSKTTCISCGHGIMEVTAKMNGGKCMVCFHGAVCVECGARSLHAVGDLCTDCYDKINPPKPVRRKFDVDLLFETTKKAICEFSLEHKAETFYAFSIDANMLCTNSVEAFKKTLDQYRNDGSEFSSEGEINALKYNTGDWDYQGFFDLEEDHGFSFKKYDGHYSAIADFVRKRSSYTKAMTELLGLLEREKVFDMLKITSDFKVYLSEHNY